jgi:putative membrane protein
MKDFNRIAFVKRFAGVISAAALASAVSLPALAQSRTEQPFQSPIGPSESPSGSPSVPGFSSVDDPGMGNGTNPGMGNGMNNGSSMERESSNRVERNSSRSIQSGDQVRSLPFRTIPGPSETPSGSPAVVGSNSSDDPARTLDRSIADRVEQAERRLEARNINPGSGASETQENNSRSMQMNQGMQMNRGMQMNMPMNQQGVDRTSSGGMMQNGMMTVSSLDREFIRMAAQGNNAEIATSQLALQKSNNQEVREYAQRMIDEHTLANQQLQPIATRYGVQLPTGVDPLSAAISERLSQLSGAEFDRAYMEAQTTAHLRTVALFQTQIAQGQAPEAKAYASTLLPNIQDHYQMANAMSNTFSAQRITR